MLLGQLELLILLVFIYWVTIHDRPSQSCSMLMGRSHPRLRMRSQLTAVAPVWLKSSDAGFMIVNSAYGDVRSSEQRYRTMPVLVSVKVERSLDSWKESVSINVSPSLEYSEVTIISSSSSVITSNTVPDES